MLAIGSDFGLCNGLGSAEHMRADYIIIGLFARLSDGGEGLMMRKGYRREAESEGSAKQRCEPMNKNLMRARTSPRPRGEVLLGKHKRSGPALTC